MSFTAVLGLDLSLTSTGVAVIDLDPQPPRISLHRIRTKGKADDTWAQREQRMRRIVRSIADLVPLDNANVLAVLEGPAYSRQVGSQHDRSGLWWLVYTALRNEGVTVAVCPIQARIRYAIGKGSGHKDIVLSAALRRYGAMVPTLEGNDEADALIMAALGARWLEHPVESSVPQPCLKALDALGAVPDPELV